MKIEFIIFDFYNVLFFANGNELNQELFEFISDNNKKYGFGVLSSVNSDLEEWFKKKKLQQYFMFVKTSNQFGFQKTDPSLYEMIVNGLEFKPNQVLLVDDSLDNLIAAEKAGLKTLKYTKSKSFTEQIKKI